MGTASGISDHDTVCIEEERKIRKDQEEDQKEEEIMEQSKKIKA